MTIAPTEDPAMPLPELTIIVAATAKKGILGIGLNGTLPWTGLKKEMAYFARVTKRAPRPGSKNTVIMGRKTWDSIPERFRPLKDRQNIVISRSLEPSSSPSCDTHIVPSMNDAITLLKNQLNEDDDKVGRTFIIGGGEIYKSALQFRLTKRILLTRILDHFEYDTIFPVGLDASGEGEIWRRATGEKMNAWIGEDVAGEVFEEAGTKYQFEMWEYVAEDKIKD